MRPAIFVIALGVLVVTALDGTAAGRIGVAATITNDVTGTVAGKAARLKSGDPVYQREIVATGQEAQAQLLFVDQTTFSLGARSRAVLDRFVFDPNRNTGSVVLNVTRGAFRFVTGTAKPTSYKVKIPVATIGVRGTVFGCSAISQIFASCMLREGAIIICPVPGARVVPEGTPAGNGCTLVDQPGAYQVSTNGGNQPPSNGTPPGDPDTNDALDNQNGTFEPSRGGSQYQGGSLND